MQIVINPQEVKAAHQLFDAAFDSKEVKIPSDFVVNYVKERNEMETNRDVWITNNGARYHYSSDGVLTMEFNANAVHLLRHIAINYDRYARVVNGMVIIAKAFKLAFGNFKDEAMKLVRFVKTMDMNSEEFVYQSFDAETFKDSLSGKSYKELEWMLNRHREALHDAAIEEEFNIILVKVDILKEAHALASKNEDVIRQRAEETLRQWGQT